jgi:hypothetical protein
MNQTTRIQKDLKMFEENYRTLDKEIINTSQQKITTLAFQYYQDGQYYLNKKDLFTAFGCINYAHGLLDAIIKF